MHLDFMEPGARIIKRCVVVGKTRLDILRLNRVLLHLQTNLHKLKLC